MNSPNTVTPSPVAAAVQANLLLLAQGIEVISRLGPNRYGERVAACFNSSAGGHFRHVIEHYQSVLAAVASGDLDYENRARDTMIETSADHASDVVRSVMTSLRTLNPVDREISIAAESAPGARVATSLGRELEFLISHTVHHYALIAVIAGLQDVVCPSDFGMAPSTIKFQQSQAACAH